MIIDIIVIILYCLACVSLSAISGLIIINELFNKEDKNK